MRPGGITVTQQDKLLDPDCTGRRADRQRRRLRGRQADRQSYQAKRLTVSMSLDCNHGLRLDQVSDTGQAQEVSLIHDFTPNTIDQQTTNQQQRRVDRKRNGVS